MNFKISKRRDFKNIQGTYAFINPPVNIEFKSETIFDVTGPFIFLKITKEIDDFLENLKEHVIDEVYKNKIYNVPKDALLNYYINPVKTNKLGKKLVESVKLKFNNPEVTENLELPRRTKVCCDVSVQSMWFNDTCFGVYLKITKVNIIQNPKKCLIVENSDNESEINLKI